MNLSGLPVAVTGGAGFLGRPVVVGLRQRGAEVFVVRSRDYDLRRSEAVERLYRKVRPKVVIHLAAVVGGIAANRAHPGQYFYDNAVMGLQMIEGARRFGVEKFIALGTICAYPRNSPIPFRESDLWSGYPEETNAPYGLAKKMMLVQAQAYREQYGFPGIYLLPVNLYGPWDNFDLESSHVIPAMIRKFEMAVECGEESVTLWGSGRPTREFLYVDDCARAIVLATERYQAADPVNIGSGREVSIHALAGMISAVAGFQGKITWDTARPDGQPRRCLDVSRARSGFGFEATVSLEEGLQRTYDWWREHKAVDAVLTRPVGDDRGSGGEGEEGS